MNTQQTKISGSLTDYAYIAGLLDADGTICMFRINKGARWESCNFTISIVNRDLLVLEWVQSMFGGFVRERKYNRKAPHAKNWQPVFDWVTDAANREAFLSAVLPFLHIKRRQAELALTFCKTIVPRREQYRLTVGQKQEREVIYAEMKQLNGNPYSEAVN